MSKEKSLMHFVTHIYVLILIPLYFLPQIISHNIQASDISFHTTIDNKLRQNENNIATHHCNNDHGLPSKRDHPSELYR